MKCFTSILFPIITIFLLFVSAVSAENCENCHEDIFEKALTSRFQHTVARNKCSVCHTAGSSVSTQRDEKEIHSKLSSRTFNKEEIFQLTNLEDDGEYEVEIIATGKNGRKSNPKVLSIKQADLGEGNIIPLTAINGVTIEEVERGIFISASLFWVTGTPATTEVEYGLTEDMKNQISDNYNFTKEHRLKISGLKKDRTYYFRVISRDILGNIAKSEIGSINTSEFFSNKNNIGNSTEIPNIDYTEVFKLANLGTFISVHLDQHSRTELTVSKKAGEKTMEAHSFPPDRYSTITVCISCHNQGASHPVGVRANGRGVITPEDLPTIENGIVTCITCHQPHGGSKEYFARMDFVRIICVKCHLEGEYL